MDLAALTDDELISLLSGADFWHTQSVPGLRSVLVSDGPHGLRAALRVASAFIEQGEYGRAIELIGDSRIDRSRVLVDHVEEHTVRLALEGGFWCAMTLYPTTKCTPARAADIIERYGDERIMVNSAGDWGPSNPLAVPDFIQEMRKRGHSEAKIRKIVYENPLQFYRQCRRFKFTPPA